MSLGVIFAGISREGFATNNYSLIFSLRVFCMVSFIVCIVCGVMIFLTGKKLELGEKTLD